MILGRRSLIMTGSLLVAALVASGVTLGVVRAHRLDPITLAPGTPIHIRLDNSVDSNQSRSGDEFQATVSEPVVVGGKTVIPQGAPARGLVVDARAGGHLMGVPRLRLELTSVEVEGKAYDLRTSSGRKSGRNHNKRNLEWIGGGAAGGAVIGAIAGGGKGALIGGPVGAGVGTAVAYFTGKKDVRFPAEAPLTFRLEEPVTIPVKG